jgi:hypothetical protein
MKPILLFLVAFIGIGPCSAQNGYGSTSIYDRTTNLPKDKHLFVLPPNDYWYKQKWADSVYLFSQFQPGKIELKTGVVPTNRPMLNYNLFLEKMLIRQSEEEYIMLEERGINTIWIGDHKFIYTLSHGYMEIILDGKAGVAEKTRMVAIYELSNGTKYPLSVADIRTGQAKGTRYYYEDKQYFIVDAETHVHHGTTTVLSKIFSTNKSKIRSFVKKHKTDFKKKEDLLEIVAYCNGEL